jgi:hypothetical protein
MGRVHPRRGNCISLSDFSDLARFSHLRGCADAHDPNEPSLNSVRGQPLTTLTRPALPFALRATVRRLCELGTTETKFLTKTLKSVANPGKKNFLKTGGFSSSHTF